MKVKNLIAELEKLDGESYIVARNSNGTYWGDISVVRPDYAVEDDLWLIDIPRLPLS